MRAGVRVAQPAIVREVPETGISEPRWHLFRENSFPDRLGPRTRALVGEERRRANLARAVTALAVLLHDGKNVFVVRDVGVRRSGQGRCSQHQPS